MRVTTSARSGTALLIAAIVAVGCGGEMPSMDDAGSDAGGRDAGRDAQVVEDDASTEDAGPDDGGSQDGGAVCGDGVVEGAEACDDGSANSDTAPDACRTDCTLAGCGDDVVDTGEDCDGATLGGATCEDEGFGGGVLACAADCSFDTTACDPCGNGTVDTGEDCDGSDLAGATCASRGHASGALACASDCTFDEDACVAAATCGDGVIGGTEQCDGAALGGQTCATRPGFASGTLACSAACTFDTSMCVPAAACGNGTAETGEACDGADLRGATCASRPGFASGPLACSATCAYDESACSAAATPGAAGAIVITEIMQNPSALPDSAGEWFEVHNPGSAPLNLFGCTFAGTGGSGDRFTVGSNVVVAAGGYATFAVSAAPGFTPSYVWTGSFALANGSDGITLTCGTTAIDTVLWDDGATFPDPDGASMTLSPSLLDATANDSGASWCEATSTYGSGSPPDRGTPGAANDACVSFPVTFCRLQFPATIAGTAGTTSPTVYGRVYAAGLTDTTAMTDVHPRLRAQLGYGPDASDPSTSAGWTWTGASANPGWNGAAAGEPNNDEYQATFTLPAAGTYDYAYRFSGDGGATWVYCDTLPPGSSDGYQIANAGDLTTTAPVSTANLFFSEYVEGSSNNKALEIYNAGSSAVDLSSCAIRNYTNGSTTFSSLTLSGSLAAGSVFVVCNNSTVASVTCDLRTTSTVLGFNGNDAIELVCSGATMDVIGQIGNNPGTEWGTGLTSTADNTLRRLCSVTTGDTNGSDPFDPSVEWSGFATDTFDGLGSRGCP